MSSPILGKLSVLRQYFLEQTGGQGGFSGKMKALPIFPVPVDPLLLPWKIPVRFFYRMQRDVGQKSSSISKALFFEVERVLLMINRDKRMLTPLRTHS
jgi:hypothetical protein